MPRFSACVAPPRLPSSPVGSAGAGKWAPSPTPPPARSALQAEDVKAAAGSLPPAPPLCFPPLPRRLTADNTVVSPGAATQTLRSCAASAHLDGVALPGLFRSPRPRPRAPRPLLRRGRLHARPPRRTSRLPRLGDVSGGGPRRRWALCARSRALFSRAPRLCRLRGLVGRRQRRGRARRRAFRCGHSERPARL